MYDNHLNAEALAIRATLPAFNSFLVKELAAFPLYFGWVDCDPGYGKFRMLLGGHDDAVALRYFWNGSYEKATLGLWQQLAKQCELIVDIGAHTGVYTLAARSANSEASVVSFEPSYINYGRLNLNMRINRFNTGNTFVHAVGDKDEVLPFSILMPMDYLSAGGALGTRTGAHVTPVQVVALDTFISSAFKPKVGMVKIDTEGHESEVIRGMTGLISASRPIIFFECIGAEAGAATQSQLEILGYRFFEVDDAAETITAVKVIAPHFDSKNKPLHSRANRLAVPNEKPIPW